MDFEQDRKAQEERRATALQKALEFYHEADVTPEDVVVGARAFLEFLNGDVGNDRQAEA